MACGSEARGIWTAGSTWGTAVQGGAGTVVLFQNLGGIGRQTNFVKDSAIGEGQQRYGYGGLRTIGASPLFDVRYEGVELAILAYGMGAEVGAAVVSGTAYSNTLTPATDKSGKFGCFAFKDGELVRQFRSVKVGGFTLVGQNGGGLTLSPEMFAWDEERGAALTNTVASIDAATVRERNKLIEFPHLVFTINNASAGALAAASDALALQGFTFTYVSPQKIVHGNQPASTTGEARILEPTCDGYIEAQLSIDRPYYETTDWDSWADFDAETLKKAELLFTGAAITGGGGNNDTFRMRLPELLVVTSDNPVTGPESIPETVTFDAFKPASAPTGMTTTDIYDIYTVNEETADLFTI